MKELFAILLLIGLGASCAGLGPVASEAKTLAGSAEALEAVMSATCRTAELAAVEAKDTDKLNLIQGRCHEAWLLYDHFRLDWITFSQMLEDENLSSNEIVIALERLERDGQLFETAANSILRDFRES